MYFCLVIYLNRVVIIHIGRLTVTLRLDVVVVLSSVTMARESFAVYSVTIGSDMEQLCSSVIVDLEPELLFL